MSYITVTKLFHKTHIFNYINIAIQFMIKYVYNLDNLILLTD